MARLSVPTTARLPSSLRVAPNAAVLKLLNRLSRPSLLSLVLDWLDERNQSICPPVLRTEGEDDESDDDDFYPLASSIDELLDEYGELQTRKGGRREVVDRVVEGDWRHGLSLFQLAMVDLQYLYDHPGSLKWSAYRILRLRTPSDAEDAEEVLKVDKGSMTVPRFHPSTFVQNLQAEVLPDVKAHYTLDRPKDMPLTLLRIFILDSPYNTDLATSNKTGEWASTSFDASRTVYIAFPDASPHIFISKSQSTGPTTTGESKSLRSLIVEGIPKALSKPRERYTLKSTGLSTKNLSGLLEIKGAGRTNAAGGGWSIYAEEKRTDSPLNLLLPTPPPSDGSVADGPTRLPTDTSRKRNLDTVAAETERKLKRAKTVATARFGNSALIDDGKGIERIDIRIEDPYPNAPPAVATEDNGETITDSHTRRSSKGRRSTLDLAFEKEQDTRDMAAEDEDEDSWRPTIRLTLHGAHVFAGVRQLVEAGIIDGEKMPGWMTGDEGVTIGAVRHGRIRGHKGSGI